MSSIISMKIILSKPIVGYKSTNEGLVENRVHAEAGEVLEVIFNNPTHYICDSIKYPNTPIAVFHSQVAEIIEDVVIEDVYAEEKFYNVYEEHSKSPLDDPFYRALFTETDE